MNHTLEPTKGIPVLRFCDRLDGFLAGVQAAVAAAKDLRVKEAVEAEGAALTPPRQGEAQQEK
jgi:hypothetical protein